MTRATPRDEALTFATETPDTPQSAVPPWKILVADDEDEVHTVTKLALADLVFFGRPLRILDAYTGEQAVQFMRDQDDIAIVLMDVVMETEQAGLQAVQTIRNQLHNQFVRIVLRTGQPGQAPEREVVTRYDINDYKEKTELTARKLFTVIHTGLGHYRELLALESNKAGLRKVVDASASIFELRSLKAFAEGVLEQLAALLYAGQDAVIINTAGLAATRDSGGAFRVLAGTGIYGSCAGQGADSVLGATVRKRIDSVLKEKKTIYGRGYFLAYFATSTGTETVLYLASEAPISVTDRTLVELFCRNVSIALENFQLQQDQHRTQREMVLVLSEAIESRSLETGNHVRRVAEYSRLLARLCGLDENQTQILLLAAPLHDAGKIAIPDAILNKPGRHTDAEFEVMRTHAELGRRIFANHDLPVLKAASIVAGQHHERWDGLGYPDKLKGEQIHIFGRITALADVFDALLNRRCYKEPWPLEQAVQYVRDERGRQFDPQIVDLFLNHMDQFLEIRGRFPESSTGDAAPH